MYWPDFVHLLNQHPLDLPRLNFVYARNIAYKDLEIQASVQQLESLTADAQQQISGLTAVSARAERLSTYLFSECGFKGNGVNYSDPRNSFLNDVLERRLGIPITLSVLYLSIARQLDIPAYGIGLPGHFIVGVNTAVGPLLLDPFHNGVWRSQEDCAALIRQTTGYQGVFQSQWLDKTDDRLILLRMVNNVRLSYARQENWSAALTAIQHLRLIAPSEAEFIRDEGLIRYKLGDYMGAAQKLDSYLETDPSTQEVAVLKHRIGTKLTEWAKLN